LADVPTVREGTSGSLLGDLADRGGGAGGATGGALKNFVSKTAARKNERSRPT